MRNYRETPINMEITNTKGYIFKNVRQPINKNREKLQKLETTRI